MKRKVPFALSLLLFTGGLALADTPRPAVVNINTADQAVLAAAPGIGKHKAQAIVEYRKEHGSFKDIHDLTQVKGVSEKALQNILKRNPGKITLSS